MIIFVYKGRFFYVLGGIRIIWNVRLDLIFLLNLLIGINILFIFIKFKILK